MATFNRRKPKSATPKMDQLRRLNRFTSQRKALPEGVAKVSKAPHRGIYLLPNAFTTAALFCGFYAIVMAMNLKFDHAAVAIFIAMVLDSLDGRIARLTNTQSEFGAQYDSLSDMVSFGAAPALVMYVWSLKGMGKLGWLAAFIHCAGAALRLARFNTNIAVVDKRYFQGLPSPAAAGLVAGFVLLMNYWNIDGDQLQWYSWFITLFAGLTMVTNVPFYSFKDVNFRKSVPFIAVFLLVLIIVVITYHPPIALFGVFVAYGLSGYIVFFWRLRKGRPVSLIQTEPESAEHAELDEH
ncbi:MAG: CDP-diacylglycerol--serine O-phosphatidyltransferase [Burkholderiales bacterium]|nr:CDP-diacylglycerol--serine O-phosphatidyltransferase [Burkholderiales bacterium]